MTGSLLTAEESHTQRKQQEQGGADWPLGLINAHELSGASTEYQPCVVCGPSGKFKKRKGKKRHSNVKIRVLNILMKRCGVGGSAGPT